jgi:hypothetical protein
MDKMALIVYSGSPAQRNARAWVLDTRQNYKYSLFLFSDKIFAHPGYVNYDRYAWVYTRDGGVAQRGPKSVRLSAKTVEPTLIHAFLARI